MRPELVPELTSYPHVKTFVETHLAMQFGDVRAMLRLPLPDEPEPIANGCNFAAAATLCNLVSGISVVLFDRKGRPPPAERRRPNDRGSRFKNLLSASYYPWQSTEDRSKKVAALYDLARNPLAHSLGVLEPEQTAFSCDKPARGLSPIEIDRLDTAFDTGAMPPALQLKSEVWHLDVPSFHSAVVAMFQALVRDADQMGRTESCFARGELSD